MRQADIRELLGLTLTKVIGAVPDEDLIDFYTSDKRHFQMYHEQDCCEDVSIAEVIGDIDDLIGSPILEAEEVCNADEDPPEDISEFDSYTWTFYKLGTIKGFVTLRWLGVSNGYYSETVSFLERVKGE